MTVFTDRPAFRLLSATLLVAGTCIGAGMLALPVTTFQMGFLPSIVAMTLCWLFMTFSALILAEATLWMEEGSHYISLSLRLLGPWAKAISWVLYLFIGYATLTAYTAEGGVLLHSFCKHSLGIELSTTISTLAFGFGFGALLLVGARMIGAINTILVLGLIAAHLFLVGKAMGLVHGEWLQQTSWPTLFKGIPLMLTIFSFQSIVPSLTSYLKRDGAALRLSIILGTTIAFVIYALWQVIILGSIPSYGEHSLHQAFTQGTSVASIMRHVINDPWVILFSEAFAFFALATSFLGVGLGLFDFLSDGLKIAKNSSGSLQLVLIMIIPTLLCALFYPRIFIIALETTGAFGDTILNGILPVLMVWKGRYYLELPADQRIGGGKFSLILILIFACFAIATGF